MPLHHSGKSTFTLLVCSLALAGAVKADEKASHLEIFKEKGFKVAGTVVAASEEADVERALNQLKTLYTTVLNAKKRLTTIENAAETNRQIIKQLMSRREQLGQMLQSSNMNSATRNAVVAQYNSVTDLITTRIEADEKGAELAQGKEQYSVPRNAYLKAVIALRDLVDKTDAKYKKASSDTSLEAAITAASKTESKQLSLGPTKTYLQMVKTFATYEAMILSEDIPLVKQANTYSVDVMLNGKKPIKMVFDTGASMISLSHDAATTAGVKETDPSIEKTFTIANGDKVKGRVVKLASVRVGKFELKNVDCLVMPKDAPASPLLLGGSFLNNFKYEVDADARKLKLVRIDGGSKSPGK